MSKVRKPKNVIAAGGVILRTAENPAGGSDAADSAIGKPAEHRAAGSDGANESARPGESEHREPGGQTSDRTEVLLIFRRGVWDLPKGKLDRGERIPECAVREVREELGLAPSDQVSILDPLPDTFHSYVEKGRTIHKTTHWFLMSIRAEAFVPQAKEQIEAVSWFPLDEAIPLLGFDTLRDLLSSHRDRLVG